MTPLTRKSKHGDSIYDIGYDESMDIYLSQVRAVTQRIDFSVLYDDYISIGLDAHRRGPAQCHIEGHE